MSRLLRWLLNEPTVTRFDPSLVVAYRGNYTRSDRVEESNITAVLATGQQIEVTANELENLIQDNYFFLGTHPLVEAMGVKKYG